ncbi:hypothetical protein HanPI659440_Chr02g0044561 [Helianthus annuus]|nr:hypothetical protein HanPI659440_Chr02g0044561 [Helianthus annuus]
MAEPVKPDADLLLFDMLVFLVVGFDLLVLFDLFVTFCWVLFGQISKSRHGYLLIMCVLIWSIWAAMMKKKRNLDDDGAARMAEGRFFEPATPLLQPF